MNKKLIIGISSIILCLLIIFLIIIFYNQKQKNIQIAIINKTYDLYEPFINNKYSDNTDNLSLFFNQILQEQEKQENIAKQKSFINFEDLNSTIDDINLEIENYSLIYLDNLNEQNLERNINKDIDRDTIYNIYNENQLIKNLVEEKNIRQEYLTYLESIKTDINYLLENSQSYYFDNNTYICKNKDIYTKLITLKEKYQLNITVKMEVKERAIPILCYHGVLDNAWGATTLFVKVQEFAKQMEYLKENNYTPIFISEINDAGMYEKPIIITFDDGYQDVYTYAYPILQQYNFKANLYVITDSIGGDVFVNEEMIIEMSSSNIIEIGSHTVSHLKLNTIDLETLEYEMKTSQEVLERITGKSVISVAYPSGKYNDEVIKMAQKYYDYGVSTDVGKEVSTHINKYKLKRLYVYREYSLEDFKDLLN